MGRLALVMAATIAVLILAGCGSQPAAPAATPDSAELAPVRAALYARHRAWQGVPYRLGGLSRQGIDCSGFVHLTYRDLFAIDLPRHTAVQVAAGIEVSQAELLPGDLVFFRTGNSRHVGIYIEQRTFLHASTSRGVMVSSLDDAYWARRFWRAVRVPELTAR